MEQDILKKGSKHYGKNKMKKKNNLFNVADFRIIRRAKNYEVVLKEIPRQNVAIFEIDEVELTVEKGDRGHTIIKCSCTFCGMVGIAKKIDCARRIALIWWLIRHEGRISEVDIVKQKI